MYIATRSVATQRMIGVDTSITLLSSGVPQINADPENFSGTEGIDVR